MMSWYDKNKHRNLTSDDYGKALFAVACIAALPTIAIVGLPLTPFSMPFLVKNAFGLVSESPAIECIKAAALACTAFGMKRTFEKGYIANLGCGIAAALAVGQIAEFVASR